MARLAGDCPPPAGFDYIFLERGDEGRRKGKVENRLYSKACFLLGNVSEYQGEKQSNYLGDKEKRTARAMVFMILIGCNIY